MGETLNADDSVDAALVGVCGVAEKLKPCGVFTAELVREGKVVWREEFPNLVVTVGKNAMEDQSLSGSAYSVTGPFMGLIALTGYSPTITTITSGTYNNGTGAVNITTAGNHNLAVGDSFTLNTLTGTGGFAGLNGTWVATAGTTGTTLNFTGTIGLGASTITGGNVTYGIKLSDTMTAHGGWLEAGLANPPTYTAPRGTVAFSAAAGGVKATSVAVNFTFTGTGTVKGAFLVFGAGAVSTIDSTTGILFSAGLFLTGDRAVFGGDQLNVSWQLSM